MKKLNRKQLRKLIKEATPGEEGIRAARRDAGMDEFEGMSPADKGIAAARADAKAGVPRGGAVQQTDEYDEIMKLLEVIEINTGTDALETLRLLQADVAEYKKNDEWEGGVDPDYDPYNVTY